MTATDAVTITAGRRSRALARSLHRRNWVAYLAIAILVLLIAAVLFGAQLAPYPASQQDLINRLVPPAWSSGGSWHHVLGTDELGRDVLSRLIVGTRLTLIVGFVAAAIEFLIGATLGIVAGYRGGFIGGVIMRWTDIQMGFPGLLMILMILLLFGTTLETFVVALAINGWMVFTRMTYSQVRRLANEPYVRAARVTGMSDRRILWHHILPHVRNRLIAVYLLEVPRLILAAAALSFLGLGLQAPNVSWGGMIGDSQSIISVAYWPSVAPGVAIVVAVASLHVFATWLDGWIDPLRRRTAGHRP